MTEQQYAYVSEDGEAPECDAAKLKANAQRVTLKSFTQVPVGDEDSLRKALTHHPVSVAVAAQAWQVCASAPHSSGEGYGVSRSLPLARLCSRVFRFPWWQFYQGGVFNGLFGFCGGGLDHGGARVAHCSFLPPFFYHSALTVWICLRRQCWRWDTTATRRATTTSSRCVSRPNLG